MGSVGATPVATTRAVIMHIVFWHQIHEMKEKMGFHHDDEHHGSWQQAGDCDANKQDGDACKVVKPGQCIPSGKCPMFHGEMVCRPNDSHPPKFVTEACEGHKEGDACTMWLMPGKCTKPKYMNDMFCKVAWSWPSYHHDEDKMSEKSTILVDEADKVRSVAVPTEKSNILVV